MLDPWNYVLRKDRNLWITKLQALLSKLEIKKE